jgi:DNA-binding NtrC family response regulator/tetratricopeptide (TPR) repeat protein
MHESSSRDPAGAVRERFALPVARERWPDLLAFDHAVLPAPVGFELEGGAFVVVRRPPPARRIRDRRIPRRDAPALFLQAAAVLAALQAAGAWADAEDLLDAGWEAVSGAARLRLSRSPASLARGGLPAAPSDALAALLDALRVRASAGALEALLRARDAPRRRADLWVAAAYRHLPPDESSPSARRAAAEARLRTAGSLVFGDRSARERALVERARAILEGRAGRPSPIENSPPPAPPRTPDEWRRDLLVPCGTVRATLRFCERLAELSKGGGADAAARARALGLAMVEHPAWRAYVADPTGDAALPPSVAPAHGRRAADPVESALARGDAASALDAARRRIEAESRGSGAPRRWFELVARLTAACPPPWPPWLELLDAEREIDGGRTADARSALLRVAESPRATDAERRAASLRLAEMAVGDGRWSEASAAAAAWLVDHRDSPAAERVRAWRIEAAALSRSGDGPGALELLDRAEALLAGETEAAAPVERIELLLARAAALSRGGRFEEEGRAYAAARALLATETVPSDETERLEARVLAAEALGLSDRRDFDGAVARLEQARAILRDDAVESARIAIDLAAVLYHAGRRERCVPLLDEAALLAASAGREDLARLALGNRVEAAIASEDWLAAEAGADALDASARRDADPTWTLVALHARGRIALRRGRLDEAERLNRRALSLAIELGDRLESGELRLEAGDLAALSGELERARAAWGQARLDPPDRCDTDVRAAARLDELEAIESGDDDRIAGLTRSAAERILRQEFEAAEAVARWSALFPDRLSASLRDAAADLLRRRGAPGLSRIASVRADEAGSAASPVLFRMRALRDAVADALSGADADSARVLPAGLASLSLTADSDGEGISIGTPGGGPPVSTALRAGSESWTLRLWRDGSLPEIDGEAAALVVETLLVSRSAASEVSPAPAASGFAEGWRRFGVVTADASMEEPHRRLRRFAPREMTVLVLGESGSGKEAVARAVHTLSPRSGGPFVAVNVSAIPSALVESELFGHARGAFTGADRDRAGLLEEAARGTIFFDEIGDLAAPLQSKLLRALQDREIRRVGENRSRRIDVRVVSATSRDLAREVEAGRFREDLYYRLHVAVIRLPRLAERGRDVLLLARHFLDAVARDDGRGPFELAPDAASALLAHAWPGNVRELQSAVGSAAALADDRRIEARLLPEAVRRAARPTGSKDGGYRSSVDAHRRDLIMEALERAGGNRSRAARELRLSRQALVYLIRELRVPARRAR